MICWQYFVCTRKGLKNPIQPHLYFCLHARVWLLIFHLEHVETKEITVKQLDIVKHTSRNFTYRKVVIFRLAIQYQ